MVVGTIIPEHETGTSLRLIGQPEQLTWQSSRPMKDTVKKKKEEEEEGRKEKQNKHMLAHQGT